jgi:hypothetical protein
MDDLGYYFRIMLIILVLLMTMIVKIMIPHSMNSLNERSDLVLDYLQIATNSGNLFCILIYIITSNNKISCQ